MTAQAYPLQWPDGWPRAKYSRESDRRFGSNRITEDPEGMIMRSARKLTMGRARDQLFEELRRLGATICGATAFHMPTRAASMTPASPSISHSRNVSSSWPATASSASPGNMRSLTLAIEAMRQLARHGGDYMMERAFTGFLAIAPPDWKKPWRQVFGIKPDWTGDITQLYGEKARNRHPDAGGSDSLMAELNVAFEEAKRELGV